MGAGKSTVGRLLAAAMNLRFADLDRSIERRAGESIAAIFERRGEAEFRRLETSALAAAAEEPEVVVATGGGIMTAEANRALMARAGTTVWLDPDFETLARRLEAGSAGSRPLFDDRVRAEALYRRRLPGYAEADLRIAVGADEEPETVTARVVERLREGRCAT